jgi:DNA polymerase I-like protein with 3'-5' exonuclease and polymerase domains
MLKSKAFGQRLEKTKNNIIDYIARRTNVRVEMWAASSIKALLDHENINDYKVTKAGLPQLPKDYLSTHKNKYLRLIAKARNFDKTKNTFIEGLLGFVHEGRIHADINQIRSDDGGTVTGRFSMSNPNLQQIPSRGFIGKKMRELFLPEDDCVWGSFDYSQQEPRIVVHYALKLGLPGTGELKKEFDKEGADFHQIVAEPRTLLWYG